MTNKTIELYTKDISRIKLPPISERVHQAVREKKSKYSEEIKNNKNKVHSNFPMKYIWAAMLAMLVISVPIVIVLSNQNTVLEQESSVQNSTEAVSKTGGEVSKSVGTNKTLEVIMKKKIFGEVALTKRPEEECEMYLMNYQHGDSVYEDDYYLYNFDSDGNLIEILNTKDVLEGEAKVDETTIKEKAEDLFSLYFPQLTREKYDIKIQEKTDGMPNWKVYFKQKDIVISESNLIMTFDKFGNLYMAVFSPATNDIGNISKIQAVDIALSEINSGKYNISKFDKNDIVILINYQRINGVYTVEIDKVPSKERDIITDFLIEIDSNNGSIIGVELFN